MPYNPWMRHLTELARESGFTTVEEVKLSMDGRARVIVGEHGPSPTAGA